MSFETINKKNLDNILKELAKEYKKLGGKLMPAEIILIGGAAIIENYGFRAMTTDVDAIIFASSIMKDAIKNVGKRFNLPADWLNDDFRKTVSYSPKLSEISIYHKTYYGVLDIRTISAEYLIAMKLKSGRKYKNDLSDIVGIMHEHNKSGNPITKKQIKDAIRKLYDNENNIPDDSKIFITSLFECKDFKAYYDIVRNNEKNSKDILIDFQEKYPKTLKADNLNNILEILTKKKMEQ